MESQLKFSIAPIVTQDTSHTLPEPIIQPAIVEPGYVLPNSSISIEAAINSNQIETINVLFSSSTSCCYELGKILKRSIYGVVLQATLLTSVYLPVSPTQQQVEQTEHFFLRTSQHYAIKVYSKELISRHYYKNNQQIKENPFNEIAALQYIGNDHSNVLGQVECCYDNSYIYSVMRFINGGEELFDYILKNGRIKEEKEAQSIFSQLIKGLMTLHNEKHISHLDISLENILYNPSDEQAVIIDFGMCSKLIPTSASSPSSSPSSVAFVLNSGSSSKGIPAFQPIINNHYGKKNYMAPEIVSNHEYVNAVECDIWSVGICLLYMLLGFPPVEIASLSDIRYQMIVNGQLSVLLKHWKMDSFFSPIAMDLIEKILRENPQERLSLEEILNHPWLAEMQEKDSELEEPMSISHRLSGDSSSHSDAVEESKYYAASSSSSSCLSKGNKVLSSTKTNLNLISYHEAISERY
jgi:serine/threonine protein kinase